MPEQPRKTIILCDFDGTISAKDVGNEIHRSIYPERFQELQIQYRAGKLNLRQLQTLMWTDFPLSRQQFREQAKKFAALRHAFQDFLRHCLELEVPFYIASCGIRDYIEAVLEETLTESERRQIHGLYSNDAEFSATKLDRLITPESGDNDLTLDKGRLARELRKLHSNCRVVGIGNGTSDRSMAGNVDAFVATDALALWAKSQNMKFTEFSDFSSLSIPILFAE